MSEQDTIRETVAKTYAKAVSDPAGSACCSSPAQKGVAAKLAGYTAEDLGELPSDTVVHSFGCGNPVAFAGVKAGHVVLDLGSGAGIDILIAGKKVGPGGRVIGVDMTDEMIARAQENISAAGLNNVEVRKGIIEDLPVDSATVDWVVSNCVINLSPDKPSVFTEIARVLKPGGQMLVSDIVVEEMPEWVRENEALYSSCLAGAISEGQYVEGLKQAGLVDVEVRQRIVYDAAQLKAFASSELEMDEQLSCCAESLPDETIDQLVGSLTNKVWSSAFYARKPVA